jgi:hypothetical protein
VSLDAAFFDDMYAAAEDPWSMRTRWYERRKYDLTTAVLPRQRFGGRRRATVVTGGAPAHGVDVLGVLVPARDEEEPLPACLAALAVAAAAPGVAGVAVEVVVADVAVVRRTGGEGNVGAARDAGARHLLAGAARRRVPVERVWPASTDADSRVPADWLVLHRTAAEAGVQALLGIVAVADWSGHPPGAAVEFARTYDAWPAVGVGAVHPHVHGANLGVRGAPTSTSAASRRWEATRTGHWWRPGCAPGRGCCAPRPARC